MSDVRRWHRLRVATLTALAAAGAACDLPLEPPRWTTAWDFTVVADTLGTANFLPQGVAVRDGEFMLDTMLAAHRVRIGDVCPLCTCLSGPVPPLRLSPYDWPVPLPPLLIGASLAAGTARVVVHNELGFDLLENGDGERGWLEVRLVDPADRAVDSLRYSGSFPPGDSITLAFRLGGLELERGARARVLGYTPGTTCQVRLDPDSGLRADVQVADARARAVLVIVTDQAFALKPRSVELPELLTRRLRADEGRGILEIEIENSVGAAVDLTLSVAAAADSLHSPGAALYTPIPVPAGSTTSPGRVHKRYVLDLGVLHGTERIYVAATSRVVGDRRVRIGGGEGVIYRAKLLAELPSR